ncbi:hypothetical protein D7I39_11130 [Allopusillimonas ginsengisoli]|nr:hypothetical protein D7I39_11130 [Allopusillimonas ginsengisoli]
MAQERKAGFCASVLRIRNFMKDSDQEISGPKYCGDGSKIDNRALALYERLYFEGLNQREKIPSRVQIPLAIWLSLLGGQFYMFSGSHIIEFGWDVCLYITALGFAFLALVISACLFFRVLSGQTYALIPVPASFENSRTAYLDEYSEHEEAGTWLDHWSQECWKMDVARHFVRCVGHNEMVNELRSRRSWVGHRFLVASGILTAIAFFCYHLESYRLEQVHKVELVSSNGTGRPNAITLIRSLNLETNTGFWAGSIKGDAQ